VARRYRNRRIGEFLKELELSEGRGTGIPKILRAMADNASPLPQFETDADRTFFLVRLPMRPAPAATGQVAGIETN
jgi:ATP-dependent DNA helicase RecG